MFILWVALNSARNVLVSIAFLRQYKTNIMKKILTLIAFILVVFFSGTHAQAPGIMWTKSLGGSHGQYGYAVKPTTDGGYIVAGSTYSDDGDVWDNPGYLSFWVVKLKSNGDTLWTRSFGNNCPQEAKSVDQTADGGYIVAGYTYSCNSDQVAGTHGENDYWIIKLKPDGALDWQQSLGGSYGEYASSVQQTTDGGYIVAGRAESPNNGNVLGNHGGSDYWIVKLKPNGGIDWKYCYGGSDTDIANSVKQTSDGGYIVAGYSRSANGDVHGNKGGADYWVVKLTSLGVISWTKSLGGNGDDIATSIYETSDGNYVVSGTTSSTNGDVSGNQGYTDYWIAKLDATDQHIIWQYCYGGTNEEVCNSSVQTTDDGFILAGYSSSTNGYVTGNHGYPDYWVIKLDSLGKFKWQSSLGGSNYDEGQSIEQTVDGGYVVAGRSSSEDGDVVGNHGSWDIWVVKIAPDPNLGLQLPITTTGTVTKNIPGDDPIEVNDANSKKLVRLTPIRGANALSGDVESIVTIDLSVHETNGQPYVQRHYDIKPLPVVVSNNAQATVTLYFTQQEFKNYNDYVVANQLSNPLLPLTPTDPNKSNVRIFQLHGDFQGSSDPGNYNGPRDIIIPNVDWDMGNNYWIVTFPVNGFSGFFLTTGDVPLPLTLVEFNGRLQQNAVKLQWLTNNEVNTKEFVIERGNQSTVFSAIGKVPAASVTGSHQYNFNDAKPLTGSSYYRLKMTGKDGNFTYSNIVPIKTKVAGFTLSAYPNPVKNILKVKVSSTGENKITLLVTDLSGKTLLNKVINIINGESDTSLNVSHLTAGTYLLKMLSADGRETVVKKFVKQ